MKQSTDRRQPIRYSSEGLRVSVKTLKASTEILNNLTACEISLKGCSIIAHEKLNFAESEKVSLTFYCTNDPKEINIEASVVYVKEIDSRKHIGFLFKSELRVESLGCLGAYFISPINESKTNISFFENQKVIAQNDADALRKDVLHLKNCQFQLILGSLPIFAALAVPYTKILHLLQSGGEPDSVYLAILVPIICIILSATMLVVFLQKTASIRRNLAFLMIIQRHLVMGSFPSCYRGWQDAYENYIHITGQGKKYHNESSPTEKKILGITPSEAFTWFGIGALSIIPIISLISLWLVLYLTNTETAPYTVIVSFSTILIVVFYVYIFYKIYLLLKGHQSFRNTLMVFSKILHEDQPFDPINIQN
jgi:PilZ domain-containing protein